MLAPVRGMYNQASNDGEPIPNPASRIGKHNKQTEPKTKINPYTAEKVSAMLKKAVVLLPRYYSLFLCAVRTGMRMGELIALMAKI